VSDLFSQVSMTAVLLGEGDIYRVELRRVWDERVPLLVVTMLNPSRANHRRNDPTVLTLIHFAKLWGYGGLLVVNLYAFRSSSRAVMLAAPNRHCTANARYLNAAIEYARSTTRRILVAWGTEGNAEGLADWFASRATLAGVELVCLGKTKAGEPKHPMARGQHRIPRDQQPIVWRAAA
jgi:hypothetical protein